MGPSATLPGIPIIRLVDQVTQLCRSRAEVADAAPDGSRAASAIRHRVFRHVLQTPADQLLRPITAAKTWAAPVRSDEHNPCSRADPVTSEPWRTGAYRRADKSLRQLADRPRTVIPQELQDLQFRLRNVLGVRAMFRLINQTRRLRDSKSKCLRCQGKCSEGASLRGLPLSFCPLPVIMTLRWRAVARPLVNQVAHTILEDFPCGRCRGSLCLAAHLPGGASRGQTQRQGGADAQGILRCPW